MPYFNVDMSLVDQQMKVVMVKDLRGQDCHRDMHLCIVFGWHWGTQVEIFEVSHHTLGIGGRHDAVEEQFSSDNVGHFGAHITQVFNTIATNSPMDMMRYHFFRAMGTDNVEVGGAPARGKACDGYEKHGVGAGDGRSALGQVVDFSRIGMLPEMAVRAFAEFCILCKLASIGIKCITMECNVALVITRWVLVFMQCMEVRGAARLALAAGSRCHGDCGWWLKLGFCAVVCWDGGIIGVCCQWVHNSST